MLRLTIPATLLLAACSHAAITILPPPGTQTVEVVDDAHGGRLFDRWTSAAHVTTFTADRKQTRGVADGEGGPNEDGTLSFADGRVLLNDEGHDYRLRSFFGWDMRGQSGIFGAASLDKPYTLTEDLLTWTGDVTAIADRFSRGDANVPAFGTVLSRRDLEALATFIVRVRDHVLPQPSDIFTITTPDAGFYALRAGGDAERGRTLYAERCAGCHGADGTSRMFDGGEFSLGSHARQKAYEDWMKILNGQPGSPMGRQVRGDAEAMTQQIRDLLAALCDRTAFPRGTGTAEDVPDGDARCGAYLR